MGRARTLREAYAQLVSQQSQEPVHQSSQEAPARDHRDATACAPLTDAAAPTQLSTAEVFHWLEDEGHFLRNKAAISQVDIRNRSRASGTTWMAASGPPAYCRVCGLERTWHPAVLEERSMVGDTSGTTTETTPSTSMPARSHKDANLASLVCTTFQEGEATRSPVVDVDMLLGRSDRTTSAYSPSVETTSLVTVAPRQPGPGRLVLREDREGMPYSLHPAIFARDAPHEAEDGEDLSASRPFAHLFSGSPRFSVRGLNAALVHMADPRLVTAIRHMTGLPTPRVNPLQAWVVHGSPLSFHDDVAIVSGHETSYGGPRTTPDHAGPSSLPSSQLPPRLPGRSSATLAITPSVSVRRFETTRPASIPLPLVVGVGDLPRDAVNTLLAPSALLAIAARFFIRRIVDRGVEALHHNDAALCGARQKPYGRGRRSVHATVGVRRVLTPAHVLGGLARHAGAGLTDSATFLVCATLGESLRRGDSAASGPAYAVGGDDVDVEEDGSRIATGTDAR